MVENESLASPFPFLAKVAAALLFITSFAFAQNPAKVKADECYNRLAFATAIPLYQKALEKGFEPEAVIRLADCYRLTNNYPKAAEWYRKVMQLQEKPPISYFHFGHVLLQEGDHKGAREQFAQYAQLLPSDPRGASFVAALDDLPSLLKDSAMVSLEILPFNSNTTDFGAFPYEGGVVFASSRNNSAPLRQDFEWMQQPYLDLFHVAEDSGKGWRKPALLPATINSRYHESNFFMVPGGTQAVFTRNDFFDHDKGKNAQGVILLQTYFAEMKGLDVGEITPFAWNNHEYSVGHACISANGREMYLVSDMPGGEGGKDIYFCTRQGTGWSQPRNIGAPVNTLGDEMFPYVHSDGTLYFASNGHPGLGNLDIFAADLTEPQPKVRNLGYPINSAYDDFAYLLHADGTGGYLSSNRPGMGDDDIYRFKVQGVRVEVIVRDKIAKLPIENAKIRVVDEGTGEVVNYTTDSTGHILFTTAANREFDGLVTTTEFDPVKLPMSTVSQTGQTFFQYIVELYNPPPAISAVVIDAKTKERLPGSHALFINIANKDSTLRVADRNGRFAIKLGKKASYDLVVTHPGYLTYTDRVETEMTQYDGDTVIPLELEMIRLNEAIVLKNIHYDYDKWYIRDDAIPDLLHLCKLLRDNPSIKIELSSHTDCRGSDEYNRVLSNKRAWAAAAFLIEQGIDSSQIIPNGYGENRLVNGCDDGVDCNEDQHFANRRTEFAIVGFVGENGQASVLKSVAEDPTAPPKYIPEAGREWFSKPTLPEAAYGKGKFRVLAGSYDRKLNHDELRPFFEYGDHVVTSSAGGQFKYYVGDYNSAQSADRAMRHLRTYGWKNASVIEN